MKLQKCNHEALLRTCICTIRVVFSMWTTLRDIIVVRYRAPHSYKLLVIIVSPPHQIAVVISFTPIRVVDLLLVPGIFLLSAPRSMGPDPLWISL